MAAFDAAAAAAGPTLPTAPPALVAARAAGGCECEGGEGGGGGGGEEGDGETAAPLLPSVCARCAVRNRWDLRSKRVADFVVAVVVAAVAAAAAASVTTAPLPPVCAPRAEPHALPLPGLCEDDRAWAPPLPPSPPDVRGTALAAAQFGAIAATYESTRTVCTLASRGADEAGARASP